MRGIGNEASRSRRVGRAAATRLIAERCRALGSATCSSPAQLGAPWRAQSRSCAYPPPTNSSSVWAAMALLKRALLPCGGPGSRFASASTSRVTRSGRQVASAIATDPPQLWPKTAQGSEAEVLEQRGQRMRVILQGISERLGSVAEAESQQVDQQGPTS